jgi:tRNA A-37 threonylcarbamoyl transferase component Bud32
MIFEYIPGEDLRTIVERKEDYRRVAHLKGLEDATLHEAGYAYLDNKASNTIISDGEPFRVDLEFLSEMDKEGINRRLDLLTLFFSFPSEHWKVLDFWKKRGFVWSLSKKL